MIEIANLLIGLASIIAAVGGVYFLVNLLSILSELIAAYKARKPQLDKHIAASVSPINNAIITSIDKSQERKVVDIPPEIIAPALKNPPKVAGGFGKKVD